jgi:predicted RNase H-like HicB family nuclease
MSQKEFAVYPAIFEADSDGITISFPDLPGAISCADTEEEAVFMAKDALGAWVVASEDIGNPIPAPSKLADIACAPNQSVCMIEAWLPLFREEQRAGSVKKNVTVPIWLNSLAERANLNFSQILQAGLKHTLGIQDRR